VTGPNAELAWRVLDTARANDEHFFMGYWAESPDDRLVDLEDLTGPACGTTACLAGWTVAMAGYKVSSTAQVYDASGERVGDAVVMAADMLGITALQAKRLFHVSTPGVEWAVTQIFGPRPCDG